MATVMFHGVYDLKSRKDDFAATKELLNRLPEKIQKAVAWTVQKEFHASATA